MSRTGCVRYTLVFYDTMILTILLMRVGDYRKRKRTYISLRLSSNCIRRDTHIRTNYTTDFL